MGMVCECISLGEGQRSTSGVTLQGLFICFFLRQGLLVTQKWPVNLRNTCLFPCQSDKCHFALRSSRLHGKHFTNRPRLPGLRTSLLSSMGASQGRTWSAYCCWLLACFCCFTAGNQVYAMMQNRIRAVFQVPAPCLTDRPRVYVQGPSEGGPCRS